MLAVLAVSVALVVMVALVVELVVLAAMVVAQVEVDSESPSLMVAEVPSQPEC